MTAGATPDWQSHPDEGQHLLGLKPAIALYPVAGSPAEAAGVRAGDLVAQIGQTPWPTGTKQIVNAVTQADRKGLELAVWRGGEVVDLGPIQPRRGKLGISMQPGASQPVFAGVISDSPLAKAADDPIPAGSRITSLNGQPVEDWVSLQHHLQAAAGTGDTAVEVTLGLTINLGEQPTEQYTLLISPEEAAALAGLTRQPAYGLGLDPLMVDVKADGPVQAIAIGAEKTKEFIQQTYITLLRLVQGSVAVKNLRGPVGIVDEGAKISEQGFAYFLFFLGLISVNLAVLNFLPIPIVDGGLMVFLLVEKIKGSPASPRVQTAVALVGIVGLACIFLYVTFNDISRIVTG